MNLSHSSNVSIAFLMLLLGCSPTPTSSHLPSAGEAKSPNAPETPDAPETPESPQTSDRQAVYRLIESGQLDRAETLAQKLLSAAPNDPSLIFMLGQILAKKEQFLDAARLLDSIPLDTPEAGVAAVGQSADWLVEIGELPAATEKLGILLQMYPASPLVHRRLSEIYGQQGLRTNSAVHLRRLIELGEFTQYDLCGLIAICEPFHQDLPPRAENHPSVQLAKARILLAKGNLEGASRTLMMAESHQPNSPALAAFRGRLLWEQQDLENLTHWVTTVPPEASSYPEYWQALGGWHRLAGNPAVAAGAYCRSLLMDATNRDVCRELIGVLIEMGREEQARSLTQRFATLQSLYDRVNSLNHAEPTSELFERIADDLDSLQRPLEALAWRSLAAKGAPDADARLAALAKTREQLVRQPASNLDTCQICGIDWKALPESDQSVVPRLSELERSPSESRKAAVTVAFKEVTKDFGLDFSYHSGVKPGQEGLLLYQSIGGGVAAVDYDLDGYVDLFCVQGTDDPKSNQPSPFQDTLFRNRAGITFQQVSQSASITDSGYSTGTTTGDLNQDGFPELLVGNLGKSCLWLNQGDGTFVESPPEAGVFTFRECTTSLATADLTGDSLPEIYVVNYVAGEEFFHRKCPDVTGLNRVCSPTVFAPAEDRIYRNHGDGRYSSTNLGLKLSSGSGLGIVIGNLDSHPGNDVFIANDMNPDEYFVATPSSTGSDKYQFSNQAQLLGCAYGAQSKPTASMGIAVGDFDRNSRQDLFVTNFYHEGNSLFLQRVNGVYLEAASRNQLYNPSYNVLGFGTQSIDVDNDGWLDLVVLNGHVDDFQHRGIPYRMKPQLFLYQRSHFEMVDSSLGPYFASATVGRSLARWDFDRDGRMDFVATHLDRPLAVVRNETSGGNWVQWEFTGTESERDAIGLTLRIEVGIDPMATHVLTTGDGYCACNERVISVGIGQAHQIDRAEVIWPSGKVQVFLNIPANQRYLVIEGNNELVAR